MLTRLKLHHESLLPFQFAASQLLILLSDSVLHCRVCCDELCVRTVQLRGTTVEPKQKKKLCAHLGFRDAGSLVSIDPYPFLPTPVLVHVGVLPCSMADDEYDRTVVLINAASRKPFSALAYVAPCLH